MKIHQILLFGFVLLVSQLAKADDSATIRSGKTFLISIKPYSLKDATQESIPFSVGYYVNKHFILGVEINSVNADYESGDLDEEVSFSNIGLFNRFFLERFLNVFSAAHKIDWRGKREISDSTGAYAKANINATAIVASVGFGNLWVTEFGLTFGIDWIVASTEVSSSHSVSDLKYQGLTAMQQQDFKDDAKEIAEKVTKVPTAPAFLVLNIGWSF